MTSCRDRREIKLWTGDKVVASCKTTRGRVRNEGRVVKRGVFGKIRAHRTAAYINN